MQHSPTEIKEKLLQALDKEYNVVDMAAVVEIIAILERTVITKEALETTRLGKYINELRRKTTDELLAKRAKDLVRRWRGLIQESNHASPSNVAVNLHNGPNHTINVGGGLAINPALRSNVGSALPQHVVSSGRLQRSASPVGRRVISPANSFSSVKSQSPNLHPPQSSLSSTDGTLKQLTGQLKLRSSALNFDPLNHHLHNSNSINIDSVPKTHASNKRLRKRSPTSDIIQSKRRSYVNGQVVNRAHELASQLDLHADGSRDSISGLSQSSSSCELIPTPIKVPISESTANTSATLSTTTTVTSTITTAVTTTSVVCTSIISNPVTSAFTTDAIMTKYKDDDDDDDNSAVAVITPAVSPTDSSNSTRTSATTTAVATTIITTSTTTTTATTVPSTGFCITHLNIPSDLVVIKCNNKSTIRLSNTSSIDTSAITTNAESGTVVELPKTRTRKKRVRLTCLTDGTCATPPGLMGDIVKEKIASKVRTPKVKTTKELVASVQGKLSSFETMPEDDLSNSNVPTNKTSLTKESITVKYRSPADALEMTRNKSEHIVKYLRSQSELHHMEEDPSIAPLAEVDEFRLQKQLGASQPENSIENYNLSPAEMSSATKDAQQSLSSKDSFCASVVGTNMHDQTVEEILARLPPLDPEVICWDAVTEDANSESSEKQQMTDEVITKLNSQHIEGWNGNVNEGVKPGKTDFREWHETVSKKSYQGEFLHILPYVIVD